MLPVWRFDTLLRKCRKDHPTTSVGFSNFDEACPYQLRTVASGNAGEFQEATQLTACMTCGEIHGIGSVEFAVYYNTGLHVQL